MEETLMWYVPWSTAFGKLSLSKHVKQLQLLKKSGNISGHECSIIII